MKFALYNRFVKTTIAIIILAATIPASAQKGTRVADITSSNSRVLSILREQSDYTRKIYADAIEEPNELVNGKEYEIYYARSKVKPLLFPGKERTASLITRTRRYNNLSLQYDTYLDEVVYTDTSRTINLRYPLVALNKNIIEGFNLYFRDDSMIFRIFRLPECENENLDEGFYEIAYEGKSRFLIKHESTFYVREALNNYKYSPKYFISTGKGFEKVRSTRNLTDLAGEKSDDVRDFLHSRGIKVRKADKDQIITVLKYFDSL